MEPEQKEKLIKIVEEQVFHEINPTDKKPINRVYVKKLLPGKYKKRIKN